VRNGNAAAVANDDVLVLRNHTQQLYGQVIDNLCRAHDLLPTNQCVPHTVHHEPDPPSLLSLQNTEDTVDILDRSEVGRGHQDELACRGDRVAKAVLDPRRGIDQHEIALPVQLVTDVYHV